VYSWTFLAPDRFISTQSKSLFFILVVLELKLENDRHCEPSQN